MRADEFLKNYFNKNGIIDIKEYINPKICFVNNPNTLKNIDVAYKTVKENLNRKIFIQVDADVDGYTSASILYRFLKYINPNSDIKWRVQEGKQHGIKLEYLNNENFDLIIIPDAGSDSYDDFKNIKNNMCTNILVLDHHHISSNMDEVCTLVNCTDGEYNNKNLCGAGVVQKFIEYYCGVESIDYDYDYDLLALGLIADMMTVKDMENRYYIKNGLMNIRHELIKQTINSLPYEFRLGGTVKNIGWYIAPRINAIVRFGSQSDKELLFKALISNDEITCKESIVVNERNKNKQDRAVRKYYDMIESQISLENVNVIDYTGVKIDSNVSGLLANKIAQNTNLPCLFIKLDENGVYGGSCRGGDAKDFKSYLESSGLFEKCAGHNNAMGVLFNSANLENIKNYFSTSKYDEQDTLDEVELEINARDIDYEFLKKVSNYCRLFGNDFKEPQFKIIINDIQTKNIKKTNDKSTIYFDYNGMSFVKKYTRKNEIDDIKCYNRNGLQGANKTVSLELICTMTHDGLGEELNPCLKIIDFKSAENKNIF